MVGSKKETLARLNRPWIHSCAAAESSGDSTASTYSATSREELDDRSHLSQEPGWTDDRHSSYLSTMEEMFVRNLYDREYCAVDICGEVAPQDCVESKPSCSFLEMLRTGHWHPFPSGRLHSWELPPPAAFTSLRTRTKSSSSLSTSTDKELKQVPCRTSIASELEQEQDLWVPDLETTESRFSDTGNKARKVNSSGSNRALKRHNGGAHRDTNRSEAKNLRSQAKECTRLDQVVPLGLEDLTRESDSSTKAIPGTVRMRR